MGRVGVLVLLCVCLSVCSALICPDGGMCEDGDTCCPTSSGGYGCCPLPNAECCADHLHCCYEGTLCDLEHSKCINKTHVLDWVEKVSTKLDAVVCPDEKSECPDDTTCCQLPDGSWGCCPMKNAVCCADKQHCCPQLTTCDLEHSMCRSDKFGPSPLWRKFAARRRTSSGKKRVIVTDSAEKPSDSNDVICPDKVSMCPDDTTCCKLVNGSYGCCPMPKAVCCSDHLHCCPEGTTCDLAHSTCVSANGVTPMVPKIPALSTPKPTEKPVPCNETVACASGTTCCKTQGGDWACCPLPEAVCCPDHAHCCPHDTVCNLAEGTCDDPTGILTSVGWVEKVPTFPIAPKSPNTKCDETSSCPDGSTCCKLASGTWGCCPLPQAVCCDDHIHCCPHDTVCNLAASTCDSTSDQGPRFSVPLLKKFPAVTQHSDAETSSLSGPERRHMCDAQTSCPRDNTCCYMNKLNKWGCCPLPKAVCCKDGDHCCPSDYICNEEKTSCTKANHEIPWYTKQKAMVTQNSVGLFRVGDVKCDSTTSCATGSTCCRLPSGQWGCCPLVKAVCCEDHEHCCPQGYTCNLQSGTCIKPSAYSIPLIQTKTHSYTHVEEEEEVACDQSTRCAKAQTCCKTSDSSWACCPYKKAVCCTDMQHCCPAGYKCDPEVKGCTKVSSLTWWENSL